MSVCTTWIELTWSLYSFKSASRLSNSLIVCSMVAALGIGYVVIAFRLRHRASEVITWRMRFQNANQFFAIELESRLFALSGNRKDESTRQVRPVLRPANSSIEVRSALHNPTIPKTGQRQSQALGFANRTRTAVVRG
jgi:hypothetical protein